MEEILKEARRLDSLSTNYVIASLIILSIGIIVSIIWAKLNTDSKAFDFASLTIIIISIVGCITGLIISCRWMHDARKIYDKALYECIEEKDYTLYINGTKRDTEKMNIREIRTNWNRTEADYEKKEIYLTLNSD